MVVGRLELVSLLPPFTDVLAAFPEVVSSSTFAEAARITLEAFLIGMALSLVVGIGVGILMGRKPRDRVALLIILFAFAFIASEAVAHFERKGSFYASSR